MKKRITLFICMAICILVFLHLINLLCYDQQSGENQYKGATTQTKYEVFWGAKIPAQSLDRWKYKVEQKLYNAEGETILVHTKDIAAYEKNAWFKEPVALVSSGNQAKYVLESEMGIYRQMGWRILRYHSGLKELHDKLDSYIKHKSGQYGIYIKNLKTDQQLIINDGRYSSASIIKLYIMSALYHEFANGNLKMTRDLQKELNNMITVSDNFAANRLVKVLGKGKYKNGFDLENEVSKELDCVNTRHGSLFLDAGDFVFYELNAVSPVDCGILLEKIYKKTLFSPEASESMLSLMKHQERRSKIPYLLPEGTICANKTGESSTVESDVGIVYSPNADYIICVLTNNSKTGALDIQQISRMVYDYFNPQA